jgi:hypothetical protein
MNKPIAAARRISSSTFATLALATLALAQTAGQTPLPTPKTQPAANPPAKPAAQEAPKFLRYVRAVDGGAKVRNIYDAQGVVVLEVPPQGLLAVHGERSGWLEVESPGGFSVWVFGEFLVPTSDAGTLQVKGSDVRMRPLPSSGPESLPLRQLLGGGDKLRTIGRKDASKPLAEDWVNVWSPPGTHAWVAATETRALGAGDDGAALWSKAVLDARQSTTREAVAPPVAKTNGDKPDTKEVTTALADAEAALAHERKVEEQGGVPNYASAREGYEKVLAAAPAGSSAEVARDRIGLCKAYEEAYSLRNTLQQQRAALEATLKKRDDDMARAAKRGVFDGRYDVRGWVEKRMLPGDDIPIYLVRWAGDQTAEVVCTSGRYDLALFVDFEIGVNGRELRGPISGPTPALTRPRELDISRIEVISGRGNLH